MAKMFTRTVTTWKASAYKVAWIDGKPEIELVGEVEYNSASTSKTEARAALVAAGYTVPRGTEIQVAKVAEETYGMDIDTFMLYAKRIDKKEVDEQ